jgi:tetraacyldisaccharide 4'-kinase
MKSVLRFLSLIYQSGCQAKNAFYRINLLHPKKAPINVVSVGNISFGGSGKTPLVLALADYFLKNGIKPAVVTRGYMGKWEHTGGILSDGKNRSGNWTESGDEPFMISLNYPEIGVFVGKNRLKSCEKAHDSGFQVVILDDGFQHRRLYRDLDIILYNPSENLPLREPLASIKRADILLLKRGAALRPDIAALTNSQGVDTFIYSVSDAGFYNLDRKEESESTLKNKRVLAFCGIARPRRFLALLEQTGIMPVHFISFPDHHPYPSKSVERIVDLYNSQEAEVCITTEKDAVKITDHEVFQDIPTFYLKIGIQADEDFFTSVLSILKKRGLPDA